MLHQRHPPGEIASDPSPPSSPPVPAAARAPSSLAAAMDERPIKPKAAADPFAVEDPFNTGGAPAPPSGVISAPRERRPAGKGKGKGKAPAVSAEAAAAAEAARNRPAIKPTGLDPSLPDPDPLSASAFQEASEAVRIFGEPLVQCIYSRAFALRESGLKQIAEGVKSGRWNDLAGPSELMHASVPLLLISATDRLPSVFSQGAGALLANLLDFGAALGSTAALTPVLSEMVAKCAETNSRMREAAFSAVMAAASATAALGPGPVSAVILAPLSAKDKARPHVLVSRLELLKMIIGEHGVGKKASIPVDAVLELVKEGLNHAKAEVRSEAIAVAVAVAKVIGAGPVKRGLEDCPDLVKKVLLEEIAEIPDSVAGAGTRGGGGGGRGGGGGGSGGGDAAMGAVAGGAKKPLRKQQPDADASASSVPKRHPPAPQRATGRPPAVNRKGSVDDEDDHEHEDDGGAAIEVKVGHRAASGPKRKEAAVVDLGDVEEEPPRRQAPPRDMRPPPVVTPEPSASAQAPPESTCDFCGASNPAWGEDELNLHMWQSCPMLLPCRLCSNVVHIDEYEGHLLGECAFKHTLNRCPRCQEPVPVTDFKRHVEDKQCNPRKASKGRCPLCHEDIPLGPEGFKRHLLVDICSKNQRSVQQPQKKKVPSNQPATSAPEVSKIPKPKPLTHQQPQTEEQTPPPKPRKVYPELEVTPTNVIKDARSSAKPFPKKITTSGDLFK